MKELKTLPPVPRQSKKTAQQPPIVDQSIDAPQKFLPEGHSLPEDIPDPLDDDLTSHESIPDVNRPLNQAKCYNKFLLKVGFEFVLYYMALSAAVLFVLLDVRRTRIFYRAAYLDIFLWVFLGLSVTLKLVSSILGPWIRVILKPFLFLDMGFSVMFIIGLYYWLQERLDTAYYTYSPFVVVFVFNLLVVSILFTITTFYRSKSRRYNFVLGIIFMTLGSCATSLGLFFGWKSVVTITIGQYIWIMVIMAAYNFYFSVNAWMVVKFRAGEILEHDSVLTFFRFWTDIFFVFWKDLLWGKKHGSFLSKINMDLIPTVGTFGIGNQQADEDEVEVQKVRKTVRRPRVRDPNEVTSSVASRVGPADRSEKSSVYIA